MGTWSQIISTESWTYSRKFCWADCGLQETYTTFFRREHLLRDLTTLGSEYKQTTFTCLYFTGALRHTQQYFTFTMAVSLMVGGNWAVSWGETHDNPQAVADVPIHHRRGSRNDLYLSSSVQVIDSWVIALPCKEYTTWQSEYSLIHTCMYIAFHFNFKM